MSKIIEFHRRDTLEGSDLSSVCVKLEDSLAGKAAATGEDTLEVDRHWRVALALASWPICLGAGAVLFAL